MKQFTGKLEYQDWLIKAIVNSILGYGGADYLSSIILTGSFGRNEPTFRVAEDGYLELKSDVEVALVYFRGKNKVNQIMEMVSKDFSESLNLMCMDEKRLKQAHNFNYSIFPSKYKSIFTFDLFNGSKTIWGRDYIGEREILVSECDKYEAKRIVANRIGELCYLQNNISSEDDKDFLRIQWKGKVLLAIASAWLICQGDYVTSYHGQYDIIVSKEKEVSEYLGQSFMDDYKMTFSFLREDGECFEVSDEILRLYVNKMAVLFSKLSLNKPHINNLFRTIKYSLKYLTTGMKYGLLNYEDNILQALILNYYKNLDKIKEDSDVWHKVLY